MRLILSFMLCLLLIGCGREPEDRTFVSAVSVGGQEGQVKVCLRTSRGESGEEESENDGMVICGTGKNIYGAIEDCAKKNSGELFFGHTSLCILSKNVTEDKKMLWLVSKYIDEDAQVSRRIKLVAADDGEKVLKGSGQGTYAAQWLNEYYQTHKSEKPVDGNTLCRAMVEKGNLLLPVMESQKKGFKMTGGVLVANGEYACDLTREESEQIRLLINDGSKPYLILNNNKEEIAKRVKVEYGRVKIEIKVKTKGGDGETTKDCAEEIRENAKKGLEILQRENCDLINMYRAVEIEGYPQEDFSKMPIEVQVTDKKVF